MNFNGVIRTCIAILCILYTSCTSVPVELRNAEQLTHSDPDSALQILQRYYPPKFSSNAEKAYFGWLYFQALEKNKLTLAPDSVISFSISYYEKIGNHNNDLALSYYYKGRMLYNQNNFKDATDYYLKALTISAKQTDYYMQAKIYSDIGTIYLLQGEYIESKKKFDFALKSFLHLRKPDETQQTLLSIGKVYIGTKEYKKAQLYFEEVLQNTTDSGLKGDALLEIATNLKYSKQYESACKFAKMSLKFPGEGYDTARRNYQLSDIYFKTQNFDSAYRYAEIALNYPSDSYIKRDSYRILWNCSHKKGDFNNMAKFITHFQLWSDSARKLETQTKVSVIETLYHTKKETKDSKLDLCWMEFILIILMAAGSVIGTIFLTRYRTNKYEIEQYKSQLNSKQAYLRMSLKQKIEETKTIHSQNHKTVIGAEREKINKQIYTNCLNLNNWEEFSKEMNHVFNQIIDSLQNDCPTITQKEITYCCLHLLEIPQVEKIILLNTTSDGMYKLKQRLSKKLKLKNTREFDAYLNGKTKV